jgi:hypothetical protein
MRKVTTATTATPFPSPAVERITPDAARALLNTNNHNRNMRPPRVAQLAEVMQRGEWMLNGETIKIADDGTLLDGQHRLQAVVDSGVEIETMVMRDLPMAAQDTVDTGRRRRLADLLAIEGKSDSRALGAALSMLHRLRTGKRIDYSHASAPSARQGLDLLEAEPQIEESVKVARRVTKAVGGPIGVFASLHRIFEDIDPIPANEFFDRLIDGADLTKGDPLLSLRNQLARPRRDRNYSQTPNIIAALTIKAFNLRRAGRDIDVLAFRKAEKFPSIDPPGGEVSADG